MSLLNMHHMLRLFWSLQLDSRISPLLKIQAWCGMIYFLSPIDVMPDFFTGVGMLDDIIMCLILLQSFVELVPRHIVAEKCGMLEIDIEKVFVSVPSTVREAMELYDWANQRMKGFASVESPDFGRQRQPGEAASARQREAAERRARAAEPFVDPKADEPAEPPRYERYSAFRKEDG